MEHIMPANWSLILNILLLIGVIIAIGRLMKARRESLSFERYQPRGTRVENSPYDEKPLHDDIIAVRKVSPDVLLSAQPEAHPELKKSPPKAVEPQLIPKKPYLEKKTKSSTVKKASTSPSTLMLLLVAKENRQFAGYELLQTLLASGLRFGEGNLFHRHQLNNGEGSVLCSVASATATGTFDLHNIGGFSIKGLCLFMHVSQDPNLCAERFAALLETGKQLSEGLDAYLLDEQRSPLTSERINQFCSMLHIEHEEHDYA